MKIKLVSFVSIIAISIMATNAIFFSKIFSSISGRLLGMLTKKFSWLYLIAMFSFVVFSIGVAFSNFGRLRLGKDDDLPEYNTLSWFAMLFCAGMGVGLVFWGVSEPISHYLLPNKLTGQTIEAADFAIRSSFMHWGIHPWSAYAVVGMGLAYFKFRKGMPGLISSLLSPFFGENISEKWIGILIDILSIFATVAGIVTSLGLGVMQISAGLERTFNIPNNITTQVIIIGIVTIIFTWSSISGLNKGIKVLSNATLHISLVLLLFMFFVGPRIDILNNMVNGIGNYLQNFILDSLNISTYGNNGWVENWRVFYWAWWIAWAPFTGMFIARISKGRTIREFIIGVVVAPTVFSIIWFSVMGSTGISLAQMGVLSTEELKLISLSPEIGLYVVLEHLGIGNIMSTLVILSLILFFITSADSGTFVLATMSTKGNINPPNSIKVIWGLLEAILAIALLLTGGLKPLQTISIVAAFPFVIIMCFAMVSMIVEFNKSTNPHK